MEKSDAIRRAVRQAPAPELPAGFTVRLMGRIHRETARRRRRETWLFTVGGVSCFAVLVVACWRLFFRQAGFDIELQRLELPRFTLPEADKPLLAMCVLVALIFLVLLLADLLIRRRIASSRS